MSALVLSLLESALELLVRTVGDAEARRLTAERMEIVAARAAADAAHAAITGEAASP